MKRHPDSLGFVAILVVCWLAGILWGSNAFVIAMLGLYALLSLVAFILHRRLRKERPDLAAMLDSDSDVRWYWNVLDGALGLSFMFGPPLVVSLLRRQRLSWESEVTGYHILAMLGGLGVYLLGRAYVLRQWRQRYGRYLEGAANGAGGEISPVSGKKNWWQSMDGQQVPYGKPLDELCKMLDVPGQAAAASVALAHEGSKKSLRFLLSVLTDQGRDWQVRQVVARAVGMHPRGRQARSVVLQLLDDPNPHVVWGASVAAASLELTEAVPRLLAALNSQDSSISSGAHTALLTLRKPGDLAMLVEMYREADYEGRKFLSGQIYVRVWPAIWREIFDLFKSSDVGQDREAAARLAHAFGGAEALPDLNVLANDVNGHVRGAASRAIEDIQNRGGTGGFGSYDPEVPVNPFMLGRRQESVDSGKSTGK